MQVENYRKKSATCDFCKEKHDEELCSIEVFGLDAAEPEVARWITLGNLTS